MLTQNFSKKDSAFCILFTWANVPHVAFLTYIVYIKISTKVRKPQNLSHSMYNLNHLES